MSFFLFFFSGMEGQRSHLDLIWTGLNEGMPDKLLEEFMVVRRVQAWRPAVDGAAIHVARTRRSESIG